MARRTTGLLLFIACLWSVVIPAAQAASEWRANQFSLTRGSLRSADGAPVLVADSAGQLVIQLPVTQLEVDDTVLLQLELAGPPPQRALVYWSLDASDGRPFRAEIAPPVTGTSTYNLGTVPGWQGTVKSLWIQLYTAPNQVVGLRRVAFKPPSTMTRIRMGLRSWMVDRSWRDTDINFITGVRQGQPPYPVPVFAGLVVLGLVLLWLLHRVFGVVAGWRAAGCLVLVIWMVSDTFWQARLWNQALQTWHRYAGKSAEEKLKVSRYHRLIAFVYAAGERIKERDARVFVASSVDGVGMLSAYYLSPLNTYWHRNGPELPAGDVFDSGDYILIIAPSRVAYDPQSGIVHREDGSDVTVRSEYSSAGGVLLKVI